MAPRPDNPDIPEAYLCEIGRIAVYWNHLESTLVHTIIMALLGRFEKDGKALSVLAHTSFPQKLDALSSLLRIIDEVLADEYRNNVQGLLKQAQEKRNAVLHQSWFTQEDGVKRFDVKARGVLKITMLPVTEQELKDTAEFISYTDSKLILTVLVPLFDKLSPQQGQ